MVAAAEAPLATEALAAELTAAIHRMLGRRPVVGLAVGVVSDGRLEFFHGHGVADVISMAPITEDTVFRIASITKTFTAIAVMQLWERGLVDLDAPANEYLRTFQLVPASSAHRPATLRHLLTHTSGIPEMVHVLRSLRYLFGESFALGEPVPSLGRYYAGGLRLESEPGSAFRYTDHNFAVAGQIVEDVSGRPLDEYFRDHIFGPLGMAHTDLLRSDRITSHLATGYVLKADGPRAVEDRQWLTAAASMIYSSPRDVARYCAALAGGGANDHGSILKPATLALMFEPQYQPEPRIPGIGLAFDRFDSGGQLVVGHEGVLPGFNSQIFIAPSKGVAVMAFTNGAHDAMFWLPGETAGLLAQILGVREPVVRSDVPQRPEVWREICGWYPFSGPLTDMRARSMFGLGAEVLVRRGQLMVRLWNPIPALFRGFVLHSDDETDPYVFRIDLSDWGMGSGRLIFTPGAGATRARVHFDLLPMSLERRDSTRSPGVWLGRAIRGLAVGAAAVAAWRGLRRRWR